MTFSKWVIHFAAHLLPRESRDIKHEEWLADFEGAPELGLDQRSVAIGAVIMSVSGLSSALHSKRNGEMVTTFVGIRFIAFTLLAGIGGITTYLALQNLTDTGSHLGFAFLPAGPSFDIEVPALVLGLLALSLGITFLTQTFRAATMSHPTTHAPENIAE